METTLMGYFNSSETLRIRDEFDFNIGWGKHHKGDFIQQSITFACIGTSLLDYHNGQR